MKTLHFVILTIITAIALGMWAGLGWLVAWLLEIGLKLDVNYDVFIWAGISIGVLKVLVINIGNLLVYKGKPKR